MTSESVYPEPKTYTALCGLHGCAWRCKGHASLRAAAACRTEHVALAHPTPR
jgi:hypothetical protein